MSEVKTDWKQVFLNNLENLTSGERAVLKRCIGLRMKEARGEAIAVFYKTVSISEMEKGRAFEETLFLFATLKSFHRYPSNNNISFGTILRQLKKSDSFDKKVYALIDSHISPEDGELSYRMAQIVRIANSAGTKIYWAGLLDDLLGWEWDSRSVQRNWAKKYCEVATKTNLKGGNKDE